MSNKELERLNDVSMWDLFRTEVESQSGILTSGLLQLERDPGAVHRLEEMMRAAHSMKGASRIVGRDAAVRVAHVMEDCFVAAQKENRGLAQTEVDLMLAGVDLLGRIAQISEEAFVTWESEHQAEIDTFLAAASPSGQSPQEKAGKPWKPEADAASAAPPALSRPKTDAAIRGDQPAEPATVAGSSDRVLRVTANNLNCLLGLAGEALIASRALSAFSADGLRLKQQQREISRALEQLRESAGEAQLNGRLSRRLAELEARVSTCQRSIADRLERLDSFDRQFMGFSARLYQEVLDCRMRPFADGIQQYPRMVRDLARSLGKEVRLEIVGDATLVDRDILERVKAPLDHLLRNAVDHAIEAPGERRQQGKPEEGVVQLTAAHRAGKVMITVADDGRGIDLESVRESVVRKNLTTQETAQRMSDAELFEFLFLPGFTLRTSVSEISGRGVGLDIVQSMVKQVGGSIRVSSQAGRGTRFQLELPLTLSVMRTLLAEINREPYAFPLARIERALTLSKEMIATLEGRQLFRLGDRQVGLVMANEILELEAAPSGSEVPVIVISDKGASYGLVVDRLLGEQELVVRPLDARLGKVKNISAAAQMSDGAPLLIVDVDDLIRNIESIVAEHRLSQVGPASGGENANVKKHILVVDDSLTVRELERKLLSTRGYAVDIAVDGVDGWNAVRTGNYDLVLTDVDMPRMDGIELVSLIRKDHRLKSLPVMIVSYKDRQEDRQRGLEAGADYYLTKGSFHDETLVRTVADLIGGVRH